MNWSASVLTTLSSDTEPTIILTFDSAKYIFNAGENTNRAFLQSRGNWKRTRGLFFTDVGMKRSSGLPGLLMSFADATISKLNIVGPPGLLHYMASMRLYTFRDSLLINPIESSWTPSSVPSPEPLYKDANITVYGIPILPIPEPAQNPSTFLTDTSSTDTTAEAGMKRKRDPSPDLPEKRQSLMTDEPESAPEASLDPAKFSPETLEGDAAQEWRRLMIKTMFPGSNMKKPDPPQQSQKKQKGKNRSRENKANDKAAANNAKTEEASKSATSAFVQVQETVDITPAETVTNVDTWRRARPPFGFHSQLPKFIPHAPLSHRGQPATPTLAYIIVGPRVRGKFDVKAAEALGVPPGPLRGRLTRGQTVTLKVKVDGEMIERVVRPEDVVGESEAPGTVVILDIPTTAHISALISSFGESPFYKRFRSEDPEDLKEYAVRSVFHICGKGVLEDERYVAFMNGFIPSVHHVVASRDYLPDPVTFTSAAFNQLRLNQLDPEIFPIPKYSLSPKKILNNIPGIPASTHLMSSSQLIPMRPPAPPLNETFAKSGDMFHPAVSSDAPTPLPSLTRERFADAQKNVEDFSKSGKVHVPKGADVKIIPLGTGSAIPTKYRNVSSTLIQIPEWGNILLDAGEGTWGQLVRQFGLDDEAGSPNVWDVLRDLKCIFVSHIHGDHQMGLAQILSKRRMVEPPPSQPLFLVSIRSVHLYIRELSDMQDLGLNDPSGNGVIPIMSESLHWRKTGAYQTGGMWQVGGDEPWLDFQLSQDNAQEMYRVLGLESFSTVDVYHRTRCYGAVIRHKDGWSIVFSGDTQPTSTLVWAGQKATLLIHEATMADDQAEMATQKAHSTFGQAIAIGKRMTAEHILLTHFSARYPKMPPSGVAKPNQIEEDAQKRLKEPIIALAFDHANLEIGKMWKMNYYLAAVEQSFRDTVEEDDVEEDGEPVLGMDVDVE
ncbi:Ribonuclease Z, mitochondrial [Hypsizygus marmoreus]|uniref:ribonuclease Z n=1 Tax=Hypsizygus marmoreus TaxID=39966 RepID=A0A369J8X5_HYPMA|nr:Ribonuclease Z, mitochondrial [Hypsizygus marmoreus]